MIVATFFFIGLLNLLPGACLLLTGDIGTIDFSTGKQQHLLGHTGSVLSLAYTSCGRLLVSGGSDCKGKVYFSLVGLKDDVQSFLITSQTVDFGKLAEYVYS